MTSPPAPHDPARASGGRLEAAAAEFLEIVKGLWDSWDDGAIARRRRMTLRELRDYAAVSSGHRVVYGTAETIADDMGSWFRAGAADGFIIQVTHHPGPLEDFVNQVIPILVERGLFRRDYAGVTLRDHLNLPRPVLGAREPTPPSCSAQAEHPRLPPADPWQASCVVAGMIQQAALP